MQSYIVKLAAERFAVQQIAPKSPCAFTANGDLALCAAAMLAWAGLTVRHGAAEAQQFEKRLAASGSKSLLEDTFQRLGWSAEQCRRVLEFNDSAAAPERKPKILGFFASLDR
jgi:hypothetical protein